MNTTKTQKINIVSQWHPEQIKAAIRMKNTTLKQVAINAGLCEAALSLALCKPQTKAEKAISEFLGVPLHELWPDRWTADGRRIRPRYAHKYITQAA